MQQRQRQRHVVLRRTSGVEWGSRIARDALAGLGVHQESDDETVKTWMD